MRLGATLVCDVGAFDGTHAKRFQRAGLRVIAFEANPHCFAALASDPSIDAAGIHLVNAAAWNKNETVRFHVVTSVDKWRGSPRTSIGSVLERVSGYGLETYESVAVAAVRLDGMLAAEAGPIALWIDVEGAGYEVIEGIADLRERVCSINIEIETQSFWQQQRLGADVVVALRELGFTPIARDPAAICSSTSCSSTTAGCARRVSRSAPVSPKRSRAQPRAHCSDVCVACCAAGERGPGLRRATALSPTESSCYLSSTSRFRRRRSCAPKQRSSTYPVRGSPRRRTSGRGC